MMAVPRYWREIPARYNLIGKRCKICGNIYFPGQIVECDEKEVHIGMRVRATFRKIMEDGEKGAIYYGYKFVKEESN